MKHPLDFLVHQGELLLGGGKANTSTRTVSCHGETSKNCADLGLLLCSGNRIPSNSPKNTAMNGAWYEKVIIENLFPIIDDQCPVQI